jgi:hypothetical protein
MDDLGLVALIMLFGIGFAFYLGGPSICHWTQGAAAACEGYVPGFFSLLQTLATGDLSSFINTYIITPLTAIVSVGSIGIAALAGYISGESMRAIAGISIVIAMVNVLFVPFAFLNSAIFSYQPIGLFIVGFFNLLLLLAIISFVLDKRL